MVVVAVCARLCWGAERQGNLSKWVALGHVDDQAILRPVDRAAAKRRTVAVRLAREPETEIGR